MNKILRAGSIAVKLCLPVLLTVFHRLTAHAQESSPADIHKPAVSYFVMAETGGLIGKDKDISRKTQVNYTGSVTQGIRLGKRLSIGGGVGIDSYTEVRTLPVFASAMYDVLGQKNKLFLRFNYGYGHAWLNPSDQFYYFSEPVKGGKMINPSIGYRINNNVWKVYLALGYKFQAITASAPYYYPYYVCPTCDYIAYTPPLGSVAHDMKRFFFTMGFGWK